VRRLRPPRASRSSKPGSTPPTDPPALDGRAPACRVARRLPLRRAEEPDEETRKQDASLRAALVEHCRDTSVIVSGYSGRDASVMDALRSAYAETGSGRLVLVWVR